ncbi:hypothetical protein FIV34_13065 [Luteibacter pinisoli]|jgi:hypothetical protein|uniref:Uncharacterized protein n=1 Tax=Luteibacter pinisoli TaxID=2589080 RepID=A0A4Y5Z494_9GAMM|nr:hypothetical protein [Luteibacter pinisoli]QDE40081.1 hypothetical protein FIV34_13065 [Luteibacter pinisoli]
MEEKKKNILHVRPPNFTAGVATGIAITGPTDDGFVHLHFFRETQRITHDDVPTRSPAPNEFEFAWARAEPQIHPQREELAVVSVPLGRLQLMANALGRAAQFVESLQEPPVRGPNKVA